ncbi:MAG: hypothetical protein ACREOA_09330, partial [Candidatus Dormibacteria bacterium]
MEAQGKSRVTIASYRYSVQDFIDYSKSRDWPDRAKAVTRRHMTALLAYPQHTGRGSDRKWRPLDSRRGTAGVGDGPLEPARSVGAALKLPSSLQGVLDGTRIASLEVSDDHHVLPVVDGHAEGFGELPKEHVAVLEMGANHQV